MLHNVYLNKFDLNFRKKALANQHRSNLEPYVGSWAPLLKYATSFRNDVTNDFFMPTFVDRPFVSASTFPLHVTYAWSARGYD